MTIQTRCPRCGIIIKLNIDNMPHFDYNKIRETAEDAEFKVILKEITMEEVKTVETAPVKRGRGRPKGSKNKPKVVAPVLPTDEVK
jgi:uncharacterized C2H2 Zn-finger protein